MKRMNHRYCVKEQYVHQMAEEINKPNDSKICSSRSYLHVLRKLETFYAISPTLSKEGDIWINRKAADDMLYQFTKLRWITQRKGQSMQPLIIL